MMIRHCDTCNVALEKDQVYIEVSLENDAINTSSIVSGLPLGIQGDYCRVQCLKVAVDNLLFKETQ